MVLKNIGYIFLKFFYKIQNKIFKNKTQNEPPKTPVYSYQLIK